MIEIAAALAILAADWGAASSHMCYVNQNVVTWDAGVVTRSEMRGPKRLLFYDRRLPVFGDFYHLIAGLRYLPMGLLAWVTWSTWEWYVGTAAVNSLGWLLLKVWHGKVEAWSWKPRWLKQIL